MGLEILLQSHFSNATTISNDGNSIITATYIELFIY